MLHIVLIIAGGIQLLALQGFSQPETRITVKVHLEYLVKGREPGDTTSDSNQLSLPENPYEMVIPFRKWDKMTTIRPEDVG